MRSGVWVGSGDSGGFWWFLVVLVGSGGSVGSGGFWWFWWVLVSFGGFWWVLVVLVDAGEFC